MAGSVTTIFAAKVMPVAANQCVRVSVLGWDNSNYACLMVNDAKVWEASSSTSAADVTAMAQAIVRALST